MHKTSNAEVDELQQKKISLGPTVVREEQESEDIWAQGQLKIRGKLICIKALEFVFTVWC